MNKIEQIYQKFKTKWDEFKFLKFQNYALSNAKSTCANVLPNNKIKCSLITFFFENFCKKNAL